MDMRPTKKNEERGINAPFQNRHTERQSRLKPSFNKNCVITIHGAINTRDARTCTFSCAGKGVPHSNVLAFLKKRTVAGSFQSEIDGSLATFGDAFLKRDDLAVVFTKSISDEFTGVDFGHE
jgi:hypothetical protein